MKIMLYMLAIVLFRDALVNGKKLYRVIIRETHSKGILIFLHTELDQAPPRFHYYSQSMCAFTIPQQVFSGEQYGLCTDSSNHKRNLENSAVKAQISGASLTANSKYLGKYISVLMQRFVVAMQNLGLQLIFIYSFI